MPLLPATCYALGSWFVLTLAGTYTALAGLAGMGHGATFGTFGIFVIILFGAALPALCVFALFLAGAASAKRNTDAGTAFGIGIAFTAGASFLAIGLGLSMHNPNLIVKLLAIFSFAFAYFAPFATGRRTG